MHIISGIYKNAKIASPNDEKTHPMGSREKLALFNMLLPYIASSTVLDVYAGSGALGLEAISRGASRVVFVERSAKIAKTIKNNIDNLEKINQRINEKTKIIIKDVSTLDLGNETFNIIIADPPYDAFNKKEIESLVKYIKNGGILALSSPRKNEEKIVLSGLDTITEKYYASAKITLFKKS